MSVVSARADVLVMTALFDELTALRAIDAGAWTEEQ